MAIACGYPDTNDAARLGSDPVHKCLRHTTRLPTVQLKREIDSIPFDLNQYRTIPIETRDPYTLLPKVQTYTAEVTNQVRRALQDAESGDNPISLYYPSAKLTWDHKK